MKQHRLIFRTFLSTLLFGISVYSIANVGMRDGIPDLDLRDQIENLIKNPDLTNSNIQKEEAFLHFYVNEKGEVVVLFVETESFFVESYLKERLNYKPLKNVSIGRYKMKVTIRNENFVRKEIQYQPDRKIPNQGETGWEGFSAELRKSITSKIYSIRK